MKQLFLEDLSTLTEKEIKKHFIDEYEAKEEDVKKYNVLIAYESVGSWGCDSSSYFLLKEKSTKKFFEVRGSHCSCYGFEGQFEAEEATIEYLKSDKFYMGCGGYDDNCEENTNKVKDYIKKLRK